MEEDEEEESKSRRSFSTSLFLPGLRFHFLAHQFIS